MSQKHILETIVDRLVIELNTYFTQVGKKQVKSKLPNLKLSVKTLIGNVLISENKVSGQGYASIHLSPNWYSDSTRYETKKDDGEGFQTPSCRRHHLPKPHQHLLTIPL